LPATLAVSALLARFPVGPGRLRQPATVAMMAAVIRHKLFGF